MPTYEYACKLCGHEFEIFQPITADSLKRCPVCKKQGLRRIISGGAGLIFKGSGFYETDYKRSAAYATDKAAAASASKPTETKSTDAKPAPAKSAEAKTGDAKPKPKPEPAKTPAAKTAKT
jgi:putative FmdB family regulatory protein